MLQQIRLTSIAVLALLWGCGGGGGGGGASPPPAPVNQVPVAEAGPAQAVDRGGEVILDGSASTDPDGSIRSWLWEQSGGPPVELQGDDGPRASFAAPNLAQGAELAFRLTVTDDDGASASDGTTVTVRADPAATFVELSGLIVPAAGHALDSDTNDPGNPSTGNDTIDSAQPVSVPTTLGGYVNQPGTGAEGGSSLQGDIDDYFRAELLAGQQITLLVADFEQADADLYLLGPAGEVIDFSISTGNIESLAVPADGAYIINVFAFEGATSYTLAVGGGAGVNAPVQDLVPWEAVVRYSEELDAADSRALARREFLERRLDLNQRGGGPRRERLLALADADADPQAVENRLGPAQKLRDRIGDPGLRARWETLHAIKALRREPGVVSAEPNYRVSAYATPNDEAIPFQWHYPLIGLPDAWETTTGSESIVVAVIDTGILAGHPDLAGQLVPGYDFVRDPRRSGDGDGIDPDPEDPGSDEPGASSFHGTHVGGTVAARGNNRIGVAGAAYGARLMPLRALAADGGTSYDINQAVRFAAGLANDSGTVPERPAAVINLSLGGPSFSQIDQQLFNDLRDRGILVVAAAGNEGSSRPAYPAAYDSVFSVSAVDIQGRLTGYSNRGSRIDLAAPGGDGRSDFNGDGYPDGVLSTGASAGGFAYTFLSGTSMAAPHVAAVFALMKSVNPELGTADLERLLRSGALTDDLGAPGRDDSYGYGLINASRAINAALDAIGGTPGSSAALAASSSSLNLGSSLDGLDFALRNIGQGDIGAVGVETNVEWLSVRAVDVDGLGLGRYRAEADRSLLADGIYRGLIVATSAVNQVVIDVLVSVGAQAEANVGTVYILLYDPVSESVADQAVALPRSGGYRFRFPSAPAGRYELVAGTDIDNDLFICDAGEACGAWLTIDQPLLLDLDSDREDIEFTIEYLVAIPTPSTTAGPQQIPEQPRRKRRPGP